MLFWKANGQRYPAQPAGVSILILLDVVLEVIERGEKPEEYRVSILILLDVVLEVRNLRGRRHCGSVSILILLDVVLEGIAAPFISAAASCFNPYSVGCCSGSFQQRVLRYEKNLFQSLFCWMLFWKNY